MNNMTKKVRDDVKQKLKRRGGVPAVLEPPDPNQLIMRWFEGEGWREVKLGTMLMPIKLPCEVCNEVKEYTVTDSNKKTAVCRDCEPAWWAETLRTVHKRGAKRRAEQEARDKAEAKRQAALAEQEKAADAARMAEKERVDAELKAKLHSQRRAVQLSKEGNVPLMKRLIKKGLDYKAIHKTFSEMYATQGKTDKKWMDKRIQTYYRIAGGE